MAARDHRGMTLMAMTALPYPHLDRATAALRAELRHQLLAADPHQLPDWHTLEVAGPIETTDVRGRISLEYRASVQCRAPMWCRPRRVAAAPHSTATRPLC